MALWVCLYSLPPAHGGTLATLEDTVATWYPETELERLTLYPTEAQLANARILAGVPIPEAPVYSYKVMRDGSPVARVYLDRHRVRTLPATVAVAIDTSGIVKAVSVLAFHEPKEYLPRPRWYEQFTAKTLGPDLQMSRGIDGITGATLSARSSIDAVRRSLALHQVLAGDQ